ncbi:MAG: DUF6436 domain-containing protein [Marinobacterium sp.]|nr:DUF6436 domain-containing protein [Marinobacterium sp.]
MNEVAQAHSSRRQQILMGLLVFVWLIAMCYAFWWFLIRDIRLFYPPGHEQYVHFENARMGDHLQQFIQAKHPGLLTSPSQGVLVHFWDPDCLCSRFNIQHVQQLIEEFGPQGIRFMVVLNDRVDNPEQWLQQAPTLFPGATVVSASTLALPVQLTASPSTAILNAQGHLTYFGPYTLGALCLPSGDGLVETVFKHLLAGRQPQSGSISGSGCFCRWPESD